MQTKQNKYVMDDVVAYGGVITAKEWTLKIICFFSCVCLWDGTRLANERVV